jgi:hypothetical protein
MTWKAQGMRSRPLVSMTVANDVIAVRTDPEAFTASAAAIGEAEDR